MNGENKHKPLADRMRPESLAVFFGQKEEQDYMSEKLKKVAILKKEKK